MRGKNTNGKLKQRGDKLLVVRKVKSREGGRLQDREAMDR